MTFGRRSTGAFIATREHRRFNELTTITEDVVEAAAGALVIGHAT
jgi:hypothetical protein